MAKDIVHNGSRSWWSGKYHASCGLVVGDGYAKRTWFRKVNCPGCLAAKNNERN